MDWDLYQESESPGNGSRVADELLQETSCCKTKSGEDTTEDKKDTENCLPDAQPNVVSPEGPS